MWIYVLLVMNGPALIHTYGITIRYGKLTIDGYDECTFDHDGNTYIYKSYDPNFSMKDKTLFGLIGYKCDDSNGFLRSTYECDNDCFIYCDHNEYNRHCENKSVKVVLAFF